MICGMENNANKSKSVSDYFRQVPDGDGYNAYSVYCPARRKCVVLCGTPAGLKAQGFTVLETCAQGMARIPFNPNFGTGEKLFAFI